MLTADRKISERKNRSFFFPQSQHTAQYGTRDNFCYYKKSNWHLMGQVLTQWAQALKNTKKETAKSF